MNRHEAVMSWSVVTHDPVIGTRLRQAFENSNRVTVKTLLGDFSSWTMGSEVGMAAPDVREEEGTLAEFEAYANELKFFSAKDNEQYWVLNYGKARADVGIAALPLLVSKKGKMLVSGWATNDCVKATLERFYDVVESDGDVAVLMPKPRKWLAQMLAGGAVYDW